MTSATPASVDLLVLGAVVITMDDDRRVLRDGAVAIRDGVIVAVDSREELAAGHRPGRTVGGPGFVITPGFIDAHVHLSHHLGRGMIPDDWPEDREHEHWLPYWTSMTPDDAYRSAQLACLEMLRNGTTAYADMSGRHGIEARVRATTEIGIRGALTEICWDIPPHPSVAIGDTDTCLAVLDRLVADHPRSPGALAWGAVTLSGMGKASDALLVGAHAIARRSGLQMAMHQSFGPQDTAAFRERAGLDAVAHLERLGVLGPALTLVHMIHVTDEEVGLLAATGTNVVHCPGASVRTAMGVSRVGRFPEMLQAGVPLALGSDSGNYSDFFDIGRQAYLAATIHREARGVMPTISAYDALEMATRGGARALGLEDELGALTPGRRADLVLHRRDRPEWHPMGDVVNTLVYSAQSTGVDTVIVEGRVVLEGGSPTLVDAERILAEVDGAAASLYDRMGWRFPTRWPVG
jgi:cytosine/adenosine deaminase-related metal-dependent hydrolase